MGNQYDDLIQWEEENAGWDDPSNYADWGNPANFEEDLTPLEIIVHRLRWFLSGFRHVAEQCRFWRSAFKSGRKYFGDLDTF